MTRHLATLSIVTEDSSLKSVRFSVVKSCAVLHAYIYIYIYRCSTPTAYLEHICMADSKKRSRLDYTALPVEHAASINCKSALHDKQTAMQVIHRKPQHRWLYAQYQVKSPTGKKNYLLHIVALRAAAALLLPQSGEHASHLCHNRCCFNVQHITVESIKINNQRKGCPGDIHCSCCGSAAYACPHLPKCISHEWCLLLVLRVMGTHTRTTLDHVACVGWHVP